MFDAPETPDAGEAGAKWRRYIGAVRRFKWLVLGIAILGTGAGIAATRLVVPSYQASATIWISSQTPIGSQGGPIRSPELVGGEAWVELIRSFAVVDRVVARAGLFLSPATRADSLALTGFAPTESIQPGAYVFTADPVGMRYTLANAEGAVLDRGVLGDPVGRSLGFRWAPTVATLNGRTTVRFGVRSPRAAALGLLSRFDAKKSLGSNLLTLNLTGAAPRPTASLLNLWASEFISTAADLKRRNMAEYASILNDQLGAASRTLKNTEAAYEGFQQRNITLPGEAAVAAAPPVTGAASTGPSMSGGPVSGQYFRDQIDYENVRQDRQALEALLANGVRATSAEEIAAIPSVAQMAPTLTSAINDLYATQAKLRAAQQLYTDEYKTVRDLKAAVQTLETQTIPRIASNAVQLLRRREAQLASRVNTRAADMRAIPARALEDQRLRRDMSVADNLYTTLQGRYDAAKLAAASAVPDVSLLDAAVGAAIPMKNTAPVVILMGIFGSLALGIGLAILLDRLDRRFRYPEQATSELGLEVMGAIPMIRAPTVNMDADGDGVEAFRSLRLNVHHSYASSPVTLAVCSPGAGDGKSTISSNLALSFADAGYRTMLIDGDTRRGQLHSTFGIQRRPGLLDYLAGDVGADDIIRPSSSHERLSIIPSGTRRRHGPELLTSARLPGLLNALADRYDVILVDTPPLGAGVDAFAIGVATGNMLMVLRTGVTDRRLAHGKLKLLDRLPVRLLGAVVNDMRSNGLYQEYSYLTGYESEDESPIEAPVPALHGT